MKKILPLAFALNIHAVAAQSGYAVRLFFPKLLATYEFVQTLLNVHGSGLETIWKREFPDDKIRKNKM